MCVVGIEIQCIFLLVLYSFRISSTFVKFFSGSQLLYDISYPFHFTKYWSLLLLFWYASMASTSYSSSPSMRSGGGLMSLGPWRSVSLYGVRRAAWKTGWIFHFIRSFSLYVIGPMTFSIVKGPSHFGHLSHF